MIYIGYSMNSVGLPNCTALSHLNNTPLLYGGDNCLLSTSQAGFFMDIHEVSKCRSVKQYIYDYEKVVFLKCFKSLVSKALIYVPTW